MRPTRCLAHGVTTVKALALTAVAAALAVPLALHGGGSTPGAVTSALAGDRAVLSHRALPGLDCTVTDRGRPRSGPTALIRTPDGRVRQVRFERGWASYTGRRPGELIAVCLAD